MKGFADILNKIKGLFGRGQPEQTSSRKSDAEIDQSFIDKGLMKLTDPVTGKETWMTPENARKTYTQGWSDPKQAGGQPSPTSIPTKFQNIQAQNTGSGGSLWDDFSALARTESQNRGYDPDTIIRQKALESGFGTSRFARERNNFGGIGAYDSNPDNAHSFNDIQDYLNNYFQLIEDRYPSAYQNRQDPQKYIQELKRGGYATDPDYEWKVMNTPFYPR